MVVFACNACGASVKKNQVEKHYQQQCRRCESLSCMDCGKDFWGEDYKQHNKCISEEAKYAAKGWEPKASANKGERKQEAWIESVNQVMGNAINISPAVRDLLSTLSQHSNIPRKKKKFMNFVSNSIHVRNSYVVEEAWKLFEAAQAKPKEEVAVTTNGKAKESVNGQQEPEGENETPETMQKKKKKKKSKPEETVEEKDAEAAPVEKKSKRDRKIERSKKKSKLVQDTAPAENGVKKGKRKAHEDEPEENVVAADDEHGATKKRKLADEPIVERLNETLDESTLASVHASKKFDWTGVVLALLGNRDDHELSLKKLRKKVVSEYECRGCEGKPNTSKEEIWAKLDKKLRKMPQVKVIRDNVKLSLP